MFNQSDGCTSNYEGRLNIYLDIICITPGIFDIKNLHNNQPCQIPEEGTKTKILKLGMWVTVDGQV